MGSHGHGAWPSHGPPRSGTQLGADRREPRAPVVPERGVGVRRRLEGPARGVLIMLFAIALIVLGVVALAVLELWLFWRFGEREGHRQGRRAGRPLSQSRLDGAATVPDRRLAPGNRAD